MSDRIQMEMLAASVLLIRYKINSVWLILGGGIAGLIARLLLGVGG